METGLRTNIQCTKNKDDEPWQIATGGDYILHMFYPIRFVILFICIVNERKTIQEWLVSSKYSLCIATVTPSSHSKTDATALLTSCFNHFP